MVLQKHIKSMHIMLILVMGLSCLLSCFKSEDSDSPRSKFKAEFEALLDSLNTELKEFTPDNLMTEGPGTASWNEDGQTMMRDVESMKWPRSYLIANYASKIQDHFNSVSLALMLQDTTGFDDWIIQLKRSQKDGLVTIDKELKRIQSSYENDPDDFVMSSYGELNPFSNMRTVGKTRDGQMYFIYGQEGYFIDVLVDVDITAWGEALKNQIEELQSSTPEDSGTTN